MSALAVDGRRTQVLIAADRLPTRIGLRLALEPEADCTEAEDADSAIAAAVRDRPDVCVVDLQQGIRALTEITARVPTAAVIVLAGVMDENEFLIAVRAGAAGYLPQNLDPARLPFVVRGVLRGEAAVPRRFVGRLITELRGRERRRQLMLPEQRRVELTAREWEVVELLRNGLATREIAEQLGISQVTVRRHLSAVERKLGVSSRVQLIRLLA